jgi:hypothetical protein
MKRVLPLALVVLLAAPLGLLASTVSGARSLVVSEPEQGNSYLYGGELTVAAPVSGDLVGAGGAVMVSAPIAGDAFLAGGAMTITKPITGDLRVVGGRIHIEDAIGGDLIAVGGTVTASSTPAFVWIAGGTVNLSGGARGPVTIYGGAVAVAGTYAGDVDIVSSDHVTIAPGTIIHGHLRYDAPQQIDIPADAVIDGGVTYTGKSFLPTTEEAKTFAVAGASIFFLVRVLALVIAAGLMGGLFPHLAQAVADRALSYSTKRFILLALLGFGIIVATPVLILLLLVSFAGAAMAFLLLAAYILLLLLSFLYGAIIAGSALARSIVKRPFFLWRDGVFGMLAVSVVGLVPIVGAFVMFVLLVTACGALISLLYGFAFSKDTDVLDIG